MAKYKSPTPKERAAARRLDRIAAGPEPWQEDWNDAQIARGSNEFRTEVEFAEADRRRKATQKRNLEAVAKEKREDDIRDKYAAPTKIPWGRSRNVPTSDEPTSKAPRGRTSREKAPTPSYKKVSETPEVARQRAADKAATAAKRKAIKTPKAPAKKKTAAPVVQAKAAPKKAPKKARAPARKARAPAKKKKGKTHWTF